MPAKRRSPAARKGGRQRAKPRAAASRGKAARRDEPTGVYLNVPGREDPILLTLPENRRELERLAMRWSYILQNRERWVAREDLLEKHRQEIRHVAASFGLAGKDLAAASAADLIEVSIPYQGSEGEGWPERIMPWEYLVATATRELRRGPLTVVRHLRTARVLGQSRAPTGKWWHLEAAVGSLRDEYDFSSERDLVQHSAESAGGSVGRMVTDPSRSTLSRLLADVGTNDVLHVSGFDPHQGSQYLDSATEDQVQDGLMVRGNVVVPAWDVAKELCAQNRRPRLVAFNIYYSAARSAAACVALGADAAIGFQDSFDDALAELFYYTFYEAWRLSDWNTVAAFRHAWQYVRDQDQPLHGSGIVLWSARSIRETLPGYWPTAARVAPATLEAGEIDRRWRAAMERDRIELTVDNITDHLAVDVLPVRELNYSVLHNDGLLFEKFAIRKTSTGVGRVPEVHVQVQLHVGTDAYPYQLTLELGEREPQVELHSLVRVSLVTALTRALRESVRTTLLVQVSWRDKVLKRETFPVTLLPIDEWIDTDTNRVWLPSFVLPRDPAVLRVIDRAQRYLMAIADDPTMGFSGYQAVDEDLPTDAPPDERCAKVDAQVRAIWSALLYEMPLHYINPPPVFSESSQRLRMPSDVVNGGRGTCIDLALLLAACLEYVEIYPAIFLLTDHAFPAYWRDESYHTQFTEPRGESVEDDGNKATQRAGQRYSWYLERAHFTELVGEIHAGRLVPLETVGLTEHMGFDLAIEEGAGNLSSRRRFQAMLDIISARSDSKTHVTPLPILRDSPEAR